MVLPTLSEQNVRIQSMPDEVDGQFSDYEGDPSSIKEVSNKVKSVRVSFYSKDSSALNNHIKAYFPMVWVLQRE